MGRTAKGCSRPVRLVGQSTTLNPRTGEVAELFSTDFLPDGVLYKPCGSRLASRCPACAEVYGYDTYHLIAAGMRGGKGVPESVAAHPAVFATFTAPSFGLVHSATVDRRTGRVRPCRPRRDRPVCPHGRALSCPQRHHRADPCVGTPLCLDCYDHDGQVAFNAFAPKLWARTIDTLTRELRRIVKATGVLVKLRELRALTWDHVDLTGNPDADLPVPAHVAVWRSVRSGGDTKTRKSRRTLALPQRCIAALHWHGELQAFERAEAGARWKEHGLVFASVVGTPLDPAEVRRAFRTAIKGADGVDPREWTPRELRHSFVSLLSDKRMPLEEISRLVGHSSTSVTELVYRRQIRPLVQTGAVVMDRIFRS